MGCGVGSWIGPASTVGSNPLCVVVQWRIKHLLLLRKRGKPSDIRAQLHWAVDAQPEEHGTSRACVARNDVKVLRGREAREVAAAVVHERVRHRQILDAPPQISGLEADVSACIVALVVHVQSAQLLQGSRDVEHRCRERVLGCV
eukprot:1698814-Prymnesium_polylepis.1